MKSFRPSSHTKKEYALLEGGIFPTMAELPCFSSRSITVHRFWAAHDSTVFRIQMVVSMRRSCHDHVLISGFAFATDMSTVWMVT